MKAVYFKNRSWSWRDMSPKKPGPGQALLAPTMAGICNTDLELLAGYHDFQGVPGHEFVAKVVSAPEQPGLEGTRVVVDINCGCGLCPGCRAGDPRHCVQRRCIGILDWPGAFARRLLAPMANLHPVPDTLPDRQAVFCEPLAAALEIAEQIHLTAGMRVLVLGDGKLGLLCALGLRVWCPDLTLAGHHQDKLDIASEGVRTRLAQDAGSLAALGRDLGPFDLVVEATGSLSGAAQALGLLRPRGVLVLKTTSHEPVALDLAKVVVDEITVMGSRCGDLGLALDFLAQGRLEVEPLIEAVYPLERFGQALDHARRPGAKKVLLNME